MKSIIGRTLFSVRNQEYSGRDVLFAAMIRNEWAPFENAVRIGIACAKASDEIEDDFEEEIESAATKFRYEHNLVAADDLTCWLDEREIDVEEWLAYIHRSMLVSTWSHRLDDILAKYPVTDDEVAEILDCDAICSGALSRFSYTLAGRAAVYLKQEDPALLAEFQAEISNADETSAAHNAGGTPALLKQIQIQPGEIRHFDADQTEIQHLLQLEEFFLWFSTTSLTGEKIRNHIRSRSMDWTRFRFRRLSFTREDKAREAAWCVKEDGLDFDDIAKQAKTDVIEEVSYYDELDDLLKELFMVVQKGSLVGPIRFEDQFSLFSIADKTAPAEQDPEIIKKAQDDLLQKIVDREITDKVRWHFRF
jgi:hypothetical protein